MSEDLFQHAAQRDASRSPLADRMRPRTLDDIVGQEHVLGPGKPLRRLIEGGELPSMILWGPPGVGKTTLAHVIAAAIDAEFVTLSAVMSGVKDIRAVVDRAERIYAERHRRTLLFVDEIHRFNKAQQDALLPHVESGRATLIGATTENPSFEVNAALLSRSKVFVLRAIDRDALAELVERALAATTGLGPRGFGIDDDARQAIAAHSAGDARRALNTLETAADLTGQAGQSRITLERVEEALQHKALLYDKAGEEHYNVVSALIKSMRGSDPDAAVYWMTRMLEAGEDPRFILRRLVIFASEDVGNADPRALAVATDALRAFELVGLPEGALALSQAVTYLASAPKSNASYQAYLRARKDVRDRGALPVPMKLRNAPTRLVKELGYGEGYRYPHDFEGGYVVDDYLPEELEGRHYYEPKDSGYEKMIGERLAGLRRQARERQ